MLSLSRHSLPHSAVIRVIHCVTVLCLSRHSLRLLCLSRHSLRLLCLSRHSLRLCAVSFASFFTSLCCVCVSRHSLRHCAVSFASYVTVLCLSRHSLCYCVVDCQTKAAQHGADDADAQAQEASDLAAANQAGIADLTSDVDALNSDNGLQVSSCCCG